MLNSRSRIKRRLWLPAAVLLLAVFFSGVPRALAAGRVNFFVTPNPLTVKIMSVSSARRHHRHHHNHHRHHHRTVYRLVAVVSNLGRRPIRRLRAELLLPPGFQIDRGAGAIGALPGGGRRKLTATFTGPAADFKLRLVIAGQLSSPPTQVKAAAEYQYHLDFDGETTEDDDGHRSLVKYLSRLWSAFVS